MSETPFEHAGSLRIGSVDFVSPDEIKVLLDIEAPDSIALNTGAPRPFPRVNSYVLVKVDEGFVVGQIEWLTVERSAFPKRRGMQDFGLIDMPYPLRRMSLNPLGSLRKMPGSGDDYSFRRGSDSLPSIGASVLLPTDRQLTAIVESGERRRVKIGTSPLAGHAKVFVDPDRIFGRHLAVLGNTGSGKSCSVAGLIRWSLEAALAEGGANRPNARFVVLDPNGEYARAFSTTDQAVKARIFKVEPSGGADDQPLQIPLWFWNSAEWCSFTQASSRTQRPVLIQGLRSVREGNTEPAGSKSQETRRFLRTILTTLRIEKNTGSPWGAFPKPKAFFEKIEKWREGLEAEVGGFSGLEEESLTKTINELEALPTPRREKYATMDFTKPEVDSLIEVVSRAHSTFGGNVSDVGLVDADIPLPFEGEALLRSVEATAEMMNVSDYAETLIIRIRGLLKNARMTTIMGDADGVTLDDWLSQYIGADEAENGTVTVLDMSLVPTEVIHTITAVVARMIFEALQRYRKIHKVALPTVLVMEEAHTYVKRYREDSDNQDAAGVCCQVFERIAREGRKFGLGLVLSSQRPSELSPTVLSQCNSFLLHRISNDRDQELVHRLVPDNLKGLLRELPSLPSQNAILLGWASELPVLVRMNDLRKAHQPQSDDPDYWDVWLRRDSSGNEVKRSTNWRAVADDWQGKVDEGVNDEEIDDSDPL
jgi:uncharacterized protein